jgi:hypothetical protein
MHRHGRLHRTARIAGALAALGALTACASGAQSGRPCTMILARVGVGLDIEPAFAAAVSSATMKICWDDVCRSPDPHLAPSTTAVPQTCSGDAPEDTCGASARRTGGLNGFGEAPGLPKRPVRVTVVLRDAAGKRLLDQRLTVTPKGVYPNGPHCGEGGPQTKLVVRDGRLAERA